METAGSRKAKEENSVSAIGRAVVITGEVSCSQDLQIEGLVNGDVRAPTVLLSEGGTINGSIYADRVRISGKVDGSVEAGDLALEASAYIEGDVSYSRLKVTPGGKIRGRMLPRDDEAASSEPASLKLVEPALKSPLERAASERSAPAKSPPEAIYVFGD